MATQLSDDNKLGSPSSDSQSKRVSHRKPKRKPTSDDEEVEEKTQVLKRSSKGCHKSSCSNRTPICCISATEKCTGSGYTSRWYHLSPGEHFCNECFEYFYRSHKDGYAAFDKWKKVWSAHGRTDPTMSTFLSDQYLPNWVQCVIPSCGKWRQLSVDADLSPEFIQKFACGMSVSGVKKERQYEACCVPEDFRVKLPSSDDWFGNCNSICLMRKSPITPYVTEYFPDGVGLSPSDPYLQTFPKGKSSRQAADDVLQLLYQPDEAERALSFRPDMMEDDELREFSYMVCHHTAYVGLRNLVIVMWQENIKSWLIPSQCIPHINCRGLSRIACITLVEKIIRYLTRKAVINIGLIGPPPGDGFLPANYNQHSVIVVGAGAAGIAAARQLKNYGTKVSIVEAQHRIGGRVWDDHSMGRCVGRGAQIVVGCVNNPISVMCKQIGTVTCPMSEKCDLITEAGAAVSPTIDRRIDFHFNAILDIIADWRKNKDIEHDISLLDKFFEMHHQFSEEAQILFTEEEEKLLHFHISNVEYACGCRLDKVSALNWDQNEAYPQFAGNHVLLPNGHSDILSRLAHGIDIFYNSEITSIDYSGDNVIVKTKTGRNWIAKKVIITVPLAALQSSNIQFTPCLPEEKAKAIQRIGAGIIEKVVMQFEQQFWTEKMNGADYIGHVPNNPRDRGMFGVFYDLSTSKNSKCQCPVLMTHISGEALSWLDGKTDQQVIDACLAKLRLLFPEQEISNPVKYFVTNWRKDPYAKMAYSYLPIGSDGSLYDAMAQDVNNKLFFAGEATHRQFPQTVTGAFLSGIREAEKIVLLSANETENAPSPNKERTL